jgi:hypothetical protein
MRNGTTFCAASPHDHLCTASITRRFERYLLKSEIVLVPLAPVGDYSAGGVSADAHGMA